MLAFTAFVFAFGIATLFHRMMIAAIKEKSIHIRDSAL